MSRKLFKGAEYLLTEVDAQDVFTPEDFNSDHKQIRDTVQQFVKGSVLDKIEDIEKLDYELSRKLLKETGDLGLLSIDTPEEFGGLDLDKTSSVIVAEEMAKGSASLCVAYSAHTGIGTLPLVYYGTKEQKEKYLEKLISGEWISAYCLTEPGSGSDALGASAYATKSEDGKHWILNGTKQYITNGALADLFTIFAKIDKEHFTAFLVEKTTEGLTVGTEEKKMGIKGSSTTQIILENAKVPIENLLGDAGKGHKIAFNALNIGRFKLGASANGGAKYALEEAVKYTNVREQFGKKISSFGALQEKMADVFSSIYTAESLVYRLCGLIDDKLLTLDKNSESYFVDLQKVVEEFSIECAISKVYCSDMLAFTVDETLQMYGGYGFCAEYPAERSYRDERINRIYEGTNEINRMLVTGTILKRAMKGELPFMVKAKEALDNLMTPSFDEIDISIPFEKEKHLLKNFKTLFLLMGGAAAQKFMMKIQDEQEVLISVSDIAIQTFAFESTLLRAVKNFEKSSDSKKELLKAVIEIQAFNIAEKIANYAKKAAHYIEKGDNLKMMLSGCRRFTKFEADDLLGSKRLIAQKLIETERYLF